MPTKQPEVKKPEPPKPVAPQLAKTATISTSPKNEKTHDVAVAHNPEEAATVTAIPTTKSEPDSTEASARDRMTMPPDAEEERRFKASKP